MSGVRIPQIFPIAVPGKKQSEGERRFYESFGHDPGCGRMILIHSLLVSRHICNISGEVDFVLLAPGKGVFLLEVKHGGIGRENGDWYTMDRYGDKHKLRVSPFKQLHDTARSLELWLKSELKDPVRRRKMGEGNARDLERVRVGQGVVFSSIDDWPYHDVEYEPWMIFTRPMFASPSGISHFVDLMEKGYETSAAWERSVIPDVQMCERLKDILIGDLEVRYDILSQLKDEQDAIDRLTDEQLILLANTRYNKRCFFTGGAGTGKTVLALQLYLEKVEDGERVGLFCFNKNLAEHLQQQIEGVDDLDPQKHHVGTLHAYLLKRTGLSRPAENTPAETTQRFFQQDLIDAFIDLDLEPEFDHLILDETQDLLSVEYLTVLDAMLKGGLAQGGWTFFGDLSRQLLYNNEARVNEALGLLGQTASYYNAPPLRINCRNTRSIGKSLPSHTGCSVPEFLERSPQGAPLVNRFPATDTKRNEQLEEIVKGLANLPGRDITVLAPRRAILEELGELSFIKSKGCRLETIQAFKGLESPVVILTGFQSLQSDEDIQLLYVGMSRARSRLYLILDLKLQEPYMQLLKRFISL